MQDRGQRPHAEAEAPAPALVRCLRPSHRAPAADIAANIHMALGSGTDCAETTAQTWLLSPPVTAGSSPRTSV